MDIVFRQMATSDYPPVRKLWESDPGIGLSGADTEESVGRFLQRNEGTNFIALRGERIIGSVLCGFDGRRGYLYHLIVAGDERGKGIGRHLVDLCLDALKERGVDKCHLFVFGTNELAIDFYRNADWDERGDLKVFSKKTS